MDAAISRNGVPIRLTQERWFHIVETHDEMAGRYDEVLSAIEVPEHIIQGYRDALVALKTIGKRKFVASYTKKSAGTTGLSSRHF